MNDTCILLGLPDYRKLSGVVAAMKADRRLRDLHLKRLENELSTADVVEPDDLPCDVVSIGSSATVIDADTGERFTTRLVFPAELDGTSATASVLSPLGVAIIGERVGASVSCVSPSGTKRFVVEAVARAAR